MILMKKKNPLPTKKKSLCCGQHAGLQHHSKRVQTPVTLLYLLLD